MCHPSRANSNIYFNEVRPQKAKLFAFCPLNDTRKFCYMLSKEKDSRKTKTSGKEVVHGTTRDKMLARQFRQTCHLEAAGHRDRREGY